MTRATRRGALLVLALAVGTVLLLLLRSGLAPAPPGLERAPSAPASAGDDASAPPRTPPRTPPPRPAPPRARSSTAPPPRAQLVEQRVALHAIASQADASAVIERNAAAARQHVERYCEEASRVRVAALLPPPSGERDAAPYMAPMTDWVGIDRPGLLHLAPSSRSA